jgi:hypothetical protein
LVQVPACSASPPGAVVDLVDVSASSVSLAWDLAPGRRLRCGSGPAGFWVGPGRPPPIGWSGVGTLRRLPYTAGGRRGAGYSGSALAVSCLLAPVSPSARPSALPLGGCERLARLPLRGPVSVCRLRLPAA